jgi:hypothetical protein
MTLRNLVRNIVVVLSFALSAYFLVQSITAGMLSAAPTEAKGLLQIKANQDFIWATIFLIIGIAVCLLFRRR